MDAIMTGGVRIQGCAVKSYFQEYLYRYSPGDTLYLAYRASQEGVLEKVTIKRLQVNIPGGIPLYIDRMNFAYNEDDLTDESTANALVAAYLQIQESQGQFCLKNCCP